MASTAAADDAGEPRREEKPSTPAPQAAPTSRPGTGFFTIYKKGQGYWTRMGTVIAAAVLLLLISRFVYTQLHVARNYGWTLPESAIVGITFALLAGLGLLVWRAMNKPDHVDFLIATDSEMKKVNWTTRKELLGSTRVVIFFVFLISALLFVLDVIFGYLFHALRVLEGGPFG